MNLFVEVLFGYWASLVAQRVKHLPAMLETRVQSLVWEDPLEKKMETHPSILAWKMPWMEEPCMLQSMDRKESYTTEQLQFLLIFGYYIKTRLLQSGLSEFYLGLSLGLLVDQEFLLLYGS